MKPAVLDRSEAPRARGPWDGLLAWRDRLLASATFRRRALSFAPTRWIARRRAARVFDLVAGFVYTQVLKACVQLRVFDRVLEAPATAAELADEWRLPVDGVARLLDAAVALRLLARRGRHAYGLGALGAALVDNPAVTAMVRHHDALYDDLRDPVGLLSGRRGGLADFWPYAGGASPSALAPERVADYSALMTASQPLVAEDVLDAVSLRDRQCLLDVGGGEGAFLAAAARRAPHLRLMLFDLPAVARRAAGALADQGLAGRADVVGGDFLRDPLPRGADVISLVRVAHDQDDLGLRTLLHAVHEALPPGGEVILAEPLSDTPGAGAMGDAYFGIYLLAMGRGRPRNVPTLAAALREAGFEDVRHVPTRLPLQASVLTARRAGR